MLQLVEDVVVGAGCEHSGLLDGAAGDLDQVLDVLGDGPGPGGDLRKLILALQQALQRPEVALLVDEHLDLLDGAGAVIQLVEQVEVCEARVHREEREVRVLGAVSQRGVGD